MKFTKFLKLKQAIANLDVNFILNKIAKLEDHLTKHGQLLEPDNTAVTEEGIYYISPESGMATKVVLYIADHAMKLQMPANGELYVDGYSDAETIDKLHEYHIVRCNTLSHAERQGWKEPFRIAQRPDGTFYYRIIKKSKKPNAETEIYQEIENQRLFICPNCLVKVSSLLEGVEELTKETFKLRFFFDVDFTHGWCRYEKRSDDVGVLADIYPKDWQEISRIRKEQMNYQCEACHMDLSHPVLKKYLYVHHTDHLKRQVGYVKLECLCIACLAEQPARSHLKDQPEYIEFLRYLYRGQSAQSDV